MAKYCSNCGCEITGDAKYCSNCGARYCSDCADSISDCSMCGSNMNDNQNF